MSNQCVCAKCRRIFRIEKNAVTAMEMLDNDAGPYRIFNFDKWKCPECGDEILKGSGRAIYPSDSLWSEYCRRVSIEYTRGGGEVS